jgi:hypothetical protein
VDGAGKDSLRCHGCTVAQQTQRGGNGRGEGWGPRHRVLADVHEASLTWVKWLARDGG